MGMFSKVLIGGIAFLAGAAFMANENEEQQKGRRSWKRIPNNPMLNADKAPLDQNALGKFDDAKKEGFVREIVQDIQTDLLKQFNLYDKAKELHNNAPQAQVPNFTCPQAYSPTPINDASQTAPQQPLFKFPLYSGAQPPKQPWEIAGTNVDFEKARQIGVLEVYRDSINELISMPEFKEFKLDKEAIKKFLDNEYVQAFLKARLSGAISKADWFRSTDPTTTSSQPSPTVNPTTSSTSAGNQQVGRVDDVVTQTEADANSVEWRTNSVVSVSGGQTGTPNGGDPFDDH